MKSKSRPGNKSPMKSISSLAELRVHVFSDAGEASVRNNYVLFTEEDLLRIGYKEEVATSRGPNERIQEAVEEEEEEAPAAHKCQDREAAFISAYSDQDSEGSETISGPEEANEASLLASHSIGNETISMSEEDKKTLSLSHSEGNRTISVGMEDNKPAPLSACSDWDSEENQTLSLSEEENKTASVSPRSIGHQTISGEEEDNDPASVSPYSGQHSGGRRTISDSEEDTLPASPFSYSDRHSEGYKTISKGEQEKSQDSLLSYSDGYSEGYMTISAGEEDIEEASYSPYSDGYSEGFKIMSGSREHKEPGVLSLYSARDSEWRISASVLDEEAKEASAFPKVDQDSERALTTPACKAEPEENKEREKHKTYVELFISKIVYHIYIKANMEPQCNDELIVCLYEYIWEKVKDEDMCITDASFKKMDNKIRKVLHKKLGNPNKVLFLLKYSDKPVVADCMISILGKLLKRPSKRSNLFCRFFSREGQIL